MADAPGAGEGVAPAAPRGMDAWRASPTPAKDTAPSSSAMNSWMAAPTALSEAQSTGKPPILASANEGAFTTAPAGTGELPEDLVDASRAEVSGQEVNQKQGGLRGFFARLGGPRAQTPSAEAIPTVEPPIEISQPVISEPPPISVADMPLPAESAVTQTEVPPTPPIDSSVRAREVSEMIREATADKPAVDVKVPDWMRRSTPPAAPVAPEPPVVQAAEAPAPEPAVTQATDVQEEAVVGEKKETTKEAKSRKDQEKKAAKAAKKEARKKKKNLGETVIVSSGEDEVQGDEGESQELADAFIDDAGTGNDIAQAAERVTGRAPSDAELNAIKKSIKSKILNTKVFGVPLVGFVGGAVAGGVTKHAFRLGASIAGIGGLPAALGVGAAGGAAVGYVKEYWKQRKANIEAEETDEIKSLREKKKGEFARFKEIHRTKWRELGVAAARGAVVGAVSATVGAGIVELAQHMDLSGITQNIPGFGGHQDSGIRITQATGTPTPGAEAVATPTPGAGAAETIAPSNPVPSEISGVGGAESLIEPVLPSEIAALEPISIPEGSDPWKQVAAVLKDKSLTNSQIKDITKELCRQSKIAVPEWGIPEGTNHLNLPPGFMLNFNDEVKRKIAETLIK